MNGRAPSPFPLTARFHGDWADEWLDAVWDPRLPEALRSLDVYRPALVVPLDRLGTVRVSAAALVPEEEEFGRDGAWLELGVTRGGVEEWTPLELWPAATLRSPPEGELSTLSDRPLPPGCLRAELGPVNLRLRLVDVRSRQVVYSVQETVLRTVFGPPHPPWGSGRGEAPALRVLERVSEWLAGVETPEQAAGRLAALVWEWPTLPDGRRVPVYFGHQWAAEPPLGVFVDVYELLDAVDRVEAGARNPAQLRCLDLAGAVYGALTLLGVEARILHREQPGGFAPLLPAVRIGESEPDPAALYQVHQAVAFTTPAGERVVDPTLRLRSATLHGNGPFPVEAYVRDFLGGESPAPPPSLVGSLFYRGARPAGAVDGGTAELLAGLANGVLHALGGAPRSEVVGEDASQGIRSSLHARVRVGAGITEVHAFHLTAGGWPLFRERFLRPRGVRAPLDPTPWPSAETRLPPGALPAWTREGQLLGTPEWVLIVLQG